MPRIWIAFLVDASCQQRASLGLSPNNTWPATHDEHGKDQPNYVLVQSKRQFGQAAGGSHEKKSD